VVTPGERPRIAGYEVETDLAPNFSFAEVMLTALTGQAPTRETGRLLEITLGFMSATSVAEAPAHAAVLARICGATSAGMLSCGVLTLAEQARAVMEAHEGLFAWLSHKEGPLPPAFRAATAADRDSVERYREALAAASLQLEVLRHDPTRTAALIAGLHACGATRVEWVEALWVSARLPVVVAEGLAAVPLSFRDYPMRLPPFRYTPGATPEEGPT